MQACILQVPHWNLDRGPVSLGSTSAHLQTMQQFSLQKESQGSATAPRCKANVSKNRPAISFRPWFFLSLPEAFCDVSPPLEMLEGMELLPSPCPQIRGHASPQKCSCASDSHVCISCVQCLRRFLERHVVPTGDVAPSVACLPRVHEVPHTENGISYKQISMGMSFLGYYSQNIF